MSIATDEYPDRWIFRPLARPLARALAHSPVHPNHLTALGAACGVGAGFAMAAGWGVAFAALVGILLWFDCADGELARLRGGGGVWGRLADGIGDYVTGIAVHLGLLVRLVRDHGPVAGLGWGLGAAFAMIWSAQLLDRYKRRYRGDVDDVPALRREWHRAAGLPRVLLGVFLPYAGSLTAGPPIRDRAAYRRRMRHVMRLWLGLGPTTHFVLWAALAALGHPLRYAQIACIPLLLLTLTALLLQRHLEDRPPAVVERAAA